MPLTIIGSEGAVLMSKYTDKLLTEAPPDEEYLKTLLRGKNVRQNEKFDFWQSDTKQCWGSENFFGEMKQSVGDMKQIVGEMKQFCGEMKQI